MKQLANSNWQLAKDAWNILRAVVREVFDESAYERFLRRTQTARCVQSYRAFQMERESAMASKPRCC